MLAIPTPAWRGQKHRSCPGPPRPSRLPRVEFPQNGELRVLVLPFLLRQRHRHQMPLQSLEDSSSWINSSSAAESLSSAPSTSAAQKTPHFPAWPLPCSPISPS